MGFKEVYNPEQGLTPRQTIDEVSNTKNKLIQLVNALRVIKDTCSSLVDDKKHQSSESLELAENFIVNSLDIDLTTVSIMELDIDKFKLEIMSEYALHMNDLSDQIRDMEEDSDNQ